MSGLVATIAHDRRSAATQAEVDALAAAYESLRGEGERHVASAGDFARLVKVDVGHPSRPGIERDGAAWAAATGSLHHDGPIARADVCDLDGQFAFAAYDAVANELTVATDPFGMIGLYVAQRAGRTYVSTSVLALAKHLRAAPSRLGLMAFLRAGYHFGRMTSWEGIERLDPGERIRFGSGPPRRETYWRPEVDRRVTGLPFSAAVEHCTEVAAGALAAQLGREPRLWSDLTGGFDSRLLNVLLARARIRFATNTAGAPQDPDVVIARRVASVAGWEWAHVGLPADWPALLPDYVSRALAWGDGNLDVIQLSGVLRGHEEKSRRHPAVVGGGGGEHFRGHAWRQQFPDAGRSTQVNLDNWVNMRLLHPPVITTVFSRDPTRELQDDFRTRMRRWAEPYAEELNTVQLDAMQAYKVTGHFGAYQSASTPFIRGELPFYTKPLYTAAFSTHPRQRSHHRLMRHMIAHLDPLVAGLDTDTGGPAEPWRLTNLHRFAPYYGKLGRQATRKVTKKVLGRTLLAAAPPPHRPRAAEARRALMSRVEAKGVLDISNMRSGRLYEPRSLRILLEEAGAPGFPHDMLFGRIVTVELALRAADAGVEG